MDFITIMMNKRSPHQIFQERNRWGEKKILSQKYEESIFMYRNEFRLLHYAKKKNQRKIGMMTFIICAY